MAWMMRMYQRKEFDRRDLLVDIVGSSMVERDKGVHSEMESEMNV